MTDLPASVGKITVTAKGVVGYADSSDAADQPDSVPMVGTVEFTPSIFTNTALNPCTIVETNALLYIQSIRCTLDANGDLRPPTSGYQSPPADPVGTLDLIAPEQTGISVTGWTWTAAFTPASGQPWTAFNITFSGETGDSINLGAIRGSVVPPSTPIINPTYTKAEIDALLAALGPARSTDGSFGFSAPTGVGFEWIFTANTLVGPYVNGVAQ